MFPTNCKTTVPTGYSRSTALYLKGNCLEEIGFDTEHGLTMKIEVISKKLALPVMQLMEKYKSIIPDNYLTMFSGG